MQSCGRDARGICIATRVPWTADEVDRLATAIEASRDGSGKIRWSNVAKHVGTRSRVQCYQRYKYTERPGKPRSSRQAWSVDETIQLLQLHRIHGSQWKLYREHLLTRTEAEIKGRFASLQRGLTSRNSDVWRIAMYAPYRDYLFSVANKYGHSHCSNFMSMNSNDQIKLVQRFKRKQLFTRQRALRPLNPNLATFPISFKSVLSYSLQGSNLMYSRKMQKITETGARGRRKRRFHHYETL